MATVLVSSAVGAQQWQSPALPDNSRVGFDAGPLVVDLDFDGQLEVVLPAVRIYDVRSIGAEVWQLAWKEEVQLFVYRRGQQVDGAAFPARAAAGPDDRDGR